tara:strand:+ start:389 stop:769 length:381 start_codon:yes stop_codon:yes gene_type:complete
MSILKVNEIQDTSGGSSNLTVPGTAKAWVSFNGTGTLAVRDSFNVTSVTDNGTGDYTVNFTNAMSNDNYSVAGSTSWSTASWGTYFSINASTYSTTAVRVRSVYSHPTSGFVAVDSLRGSVQIFGD